MNRSLCMEGDFPREWMTSIQTATSAVLVTSSQVSTSAARRPARRKRKHKMCQDAYMRFGQDYSREDTPHPSFKLHPDTPAERGPACRVLNPHPSCVFVPKKKPQQPLKKQGCEQEEGLAAFVSHHLLQRGSTTDPTEDFVLCKLLKETHRTVW